MVVGNLDSIKVLKYQTPDHWAQEALADPLALLSDHAYLERKAASNVLELFNRWPDPPSPSATTPEGWATTLAGVARDEARHLEMVLCLLRRRRGTLQRLHKNLYANDLRGLVRTGKGKQELLDRLLVSALIEVRSCERFGILARVAQDKELAEFYAGLAGSEAGHYAVFIDLAKGFLPEPEVAVRWREMLTDEARIIQAQPRGSRIHSGL